MSLKSECINDTDERIDDADEGQTWRNPGEFPAFNQPLASEEHMKESKEMERKSIIHKYSEKMLYQDAAGKDHLITFDPDTLVDHALESSEDMLVAGIELQKMADNWQNDHQLIVSGKISPSLPRIRKTDSLMKKYIEKHYLDTDERKGLSMQTFTANPGTLLQKFGKRVQLPDQDGQFREVIDNPFALIPEQQYLQSPHKLQSFGQSLESMAKRWGAKHPRTRAERIQRFSDLVVKTTTPESRELQGEEKLNSILEHATPEGVTRFLQHINSQLRNNRPSKGSEIIGRKDPGQRMTVGENHQTYGTMGEASLIAPDPELQQELLAEYLDAIKTAEGRERKAALAFYAINNLHLFKDGNGRTSRLVYQMIRNGDISEISDDYIEHESESVRTEGKGRGDFLHNNNLPSPEQINNMANEFLQEELCDSSILDIRLRDKRIHLNSYDEKGNLVKVFMQKKDYQQLSEEDRQALAYALSDGNAINRTTLSGLTLISILQQKGKTSEIIATLGSERQLGIDVNFDDYDGPSQEQYEKVKQIFAEWTPDDYRKTIDVYRLFKKRQSEIVMRFFTDDMKFDDGSSVARWASGQLNPS